MKKLFAFLFRREKFFSSPRGLFIERREVKKVVIQNAQAL